MNRRALLKWLAQISALSVAAVVLPNRSAGAGLVSAAGDVQALALGSRLKGTARGEILESRDGGETWQVIAKFGEHLRVLSIAERGGQAYVQLGLQVFDFTLRSANLRTWYTI